MNLYSLVALFYLGPVLPVNIEGFQQDVHEMASIRAVYPEKAAAIQSAHELAVTYLKEAKRTLNNLNNPSEIYTNHAQWLSNFLGVNRITDAYQSQLSTAINAILDRLLKPAMNPLSSGRYIVGTSVDKLTNNRIAFVTSLNRRKYIYLDNNFFDTPLDPFNTGHMPGLIETQPPFDYNRHFRASTLIHECSHQVASTYDIAYLNAPGLIPNFSSRVPPRPWSTVQRLRPTKKINSLKQRPDPIYLMTPSLKTSLLVTWF